MAQPTVTTFKNALVYFETDTPGTYTKFCGLESFTITRSKETNDTNVPDCDDPDAAVWLSRDVVSLSWEFSGEGLLTKEQIARVNDMVESANSVNMRVYIKGFGTGGATPDLRLDGRVHLSDEINATRGEKVSQSLTGVGDGPLTSSSVAAI
jgi:hypothetical protein